MTKRLAIMTAKFVGGPKDGECCLSPKWFKDVMPEKVKVKSQLLRLKRKMVFHEYDRGASYRAGGYEIYLYTYRGIRASD